MNDKKSSEDRLIIFKKFYESNISTLIQFAQRFVPIEIAKDIVHDIFVEVWDKSEENNKYLSLSYLFMTVRNKCLNIIKREQVKRNYLNSYELENLILQLNYYQSYEQHLIYIEKIHTVYIEIEKLPAKCKVIFKMAYIQEMKNADIAEKLDISIRTVEHQLYLGLKTLRERLNFSDIK